MTESTADLVARLRARQEAEADPVTMLLERLRIMSEQLDEIEQAKKRDDRTGGGKRADRFWQIVAAVLTAMLIASIFGWVNLERRVALIESNRFTAEMARLMEARILTGVPPAWFRELVTANTTTLHDLEERVRAVESGGKQ